MWRVSHSPILNIFPLSTFFIRTCCAQDEAAVDRILQSVIAQYEQLYEQYNAQYGAPHMKLSIE